VTNTLLSEANIKKEEDAALQLQVIGNAIEST